MNQLCPTALLAGIAMLTLALSPTLLRAAEPEQSPTTALDRYIAEPDDSFAWELVHTSETNGVTGHVLRLTSQRWRAPGEVDRQTWQHHLLMARPAEVRSKTGLLFVGGGSNRDRMPAGPSDRLVQIARSTGTVTAEVRMIPNQPLVFDNDGTHRYEDDLIAYTWDQYLEGGDEKWPAQLPMVKSVVRAMDAVQAFASSEQGGRNTVERFVVAGASKRGWTTWLTAAVDDRVAAIVPIVIDVLNIDRSMRHHAAAYGYWAPAVGDYVRHGITRRLDTPRHAELLKTVDPFVYRRRLDMPKYIVNASGDQYFLPDSAQFYIGELPGENLLRYVPNTDHSLRDSDALQSVVGFYLAIAREQPLPQVRWRWDDSGAIYVQSTPEPQAALLWQATNKASRDFRLQTIGAGYRSHLLTPNDQGDYSASVEGPDDGWTAYFVELTFATAAGMPLKVSTPVRVVPDRLPHADQDPAEFTIGK